VSGHVPGGRRAARALAEPDEPGRIVQDESNHPAGTYSAPSAVNDAAHAPGHGYQQPYDDEDSLTDYSGDGEYPAYDADGEAYYPHPETVEHAPYEEAPLPSRRTSRVSKRVRRRRRTVVFLIVLALFAGVVVFTVQLVKPMFGALDAADYPGPGTGNVQIVIPEGATGRTVAAELKAENVVASEQAFLDALNNSQASGSLQPGSFEMHKEMKASAAVALLIDNDANKVRYSAVDQNLRMGETLALLAKSTGIPLAEFTTLANKPADFGLPAKAKNLEGYLYPGEYRFPIDYTAKQILQEMVDGTKKALGSAGVTDPAEQFRVITIASIIEFEGNEANYGMISGAIENRLNNPNAETGGRLESDATVAYGLGIKTYNITDAQKADKSNLYNTFANPGLPVGPIGSPSALAIDAAAHPKANPYYFWVTVNLKTGETLYATTYAQHLKNVAVYQTWCTDNPGECN
jgi:UPF0755 protein